MSITHSIVLPYGRTAAVDQECQLAIYRGDLEHPSAPGNKWHKLQHHLQAARAQNVTTIGTFGGPFSNHLHAFGATLKDLPFKAVAVVRGELQPTLTPTLRDMADQGVELWPSQRKDFRLGELSDVANCITSRHQDIYWIPEGGGGLLGALGCRDWAEQIYAANPDYDAWVVASGTGTTAAGFLACSHVPALHVFSALKGEPEQKATILDVADTLSDACVSMSDLKGKLHFHGDCHEGGYAKHSQRLIDFMAEFARCNPTEVLDPVYTCKALRAVCQAIETGQWPYRRTLFIHTGGLQGWRGYPQSRNPFVGR
ncbi:cysteine desulfhydrase [Marinomonas sp. A79]|uniref:Cysteine desulfhydrase n=1 Tax=Marinomonas vulgaris TaxID=2823372 RepID=A0ABS5H9Z7_9GAMM|nr:cysteine desulfhydrase [Marinomonas vulgaris]MBR7888501.1 cysteine desulfhydrase [Marinomonas vulgaris]